MITPVLISSALVGFFLLTPAPLQAQDARDEIEAIVKDYIASHPSELGQIVKDYLVTHPEAVGEIMVSVLKHRRSANGVAKSSIAVPRADPKVARHSDAVASNAAALFSSPHQVTLGNPEGDVTLVEFFDYSCGFCKRALPDMLALLEDDPKLKIVLKELPILGPGSADAARVAIAVRMQSSDGQKYLAFHQKLLSGAGPATRDKALAVAQDQGFDLARLDQEITSDEVQATISEDAKLASALGLTGTPSYVIGDQVIVGAVGIAALKERIAAARGHDLN
jgi:protein-disulfide isomerase